MLKKKPDIFLGITMGMLVLAAVLCLVILIAQKTAKPKTSTAGNNPPAVLNSGETDSSMTPADTNSSQPVESDPTRPDPVQVDVTAIDDVSLKADLDDCLSGLPNDWQVMVMDPTVGTQVAAVINSPNADGWMKGDRMVSVFVMGAAFQAVADGTLTEDQILEDVTAMIVRSDGEATDRLTALLGGGDAAKGMEAVKTFATDNGLKLGYNRTMAGVGSNPNYVTATQMSAILNMICRGELVSKDASAQMEEILLTPKDNDLFGRSLTSENVECGFVCASKDKEYVGAMGIVRIPYGSGQRTFVISVICNGPNTLSNAEKKAVDLIDLTVPYFAD